MKFKFQTSLWHLLAWTLVAGLLFAAISNYQISRIASSRIERLNQLEVNHLINNKVIQLLSQLSPRFEEERPFVHRVIGRLPENSIDWYPYAAQLFPFNESSPNQELLVLRYDEGDKPGSVETVFALFQNGRLTDIKTRVKPTWFDSFSTIEIVENSNTKSVVSIGNTVTYFVTEQGTFEAR